MIAIYIIFHTIIFIPFFILHTRDELLLRRFRDKMNSKGAGVSDKDLDMYALYKKKVKSGSYVLGILMVLQIIDVVILYAGGFFG